MYVPPPGRVSDYPAHPLSLTPGSSCTATGTEPDQGRQARRGAHRYVPASSPLLPTAGRITVLRALTCSSPLVPIRTDAREPGELEQTGRIPGSINVPITSSPDSFHIKDEDFEDRFGFPRPDKDAEVVFYCKAGVRSRAAAGLARDAGWTNVAEYPGSWVDWVGKGGKIQR